MEGPERKVARVEEENCFNCGNCKMQIWVSEYMGTKHRNHCPFCLFSKHVDQNKPGDRKSNCKSRMKPIGLTYKNEATNKYKPSDGGEIMLIHLCTNNDCEKISINRIAGDDSAYALKEVFLKSLDMDENLRHKLEDEGITPLSEDDFPSIQKQLPEEIF